MPQIQVSDEIYRRIERLAIPFVDRTPEDVLRRMLDSFEEGNRTKASRRPAISAAGSGPSRKDRGKQIREQYIARLQAEDIDVRIEDGVWGYLEVTKSWVAFPSATEGRLGRWWLGLGEEDISQKQCAAIVLLCCHESGTITDIVLPLHAVDEIVPRLSQSKGHLKFNVRRTGNRWELMIPRVGPFDVSEYIGAREVLRLKVR